MIDYNILIVFALIVTNGILAMSELALVSSRKSRLENLANHGDRNAVAALRLIADPSRFLATVQIGITLVGIVAGVFSGATIGQRLGAWLDTFPLLHPYGTPIGMAVTIIAITYLSLIFGELVPKRIAMTRPEQIAGLVAHPMLLLSRVASPLVWILHVSTETILRLLRLTTASESSVSEEEVKALIREGTHAGIFEPEEQNMIDGILRMDDRIIRIVMTPRSDIIWLDAAAGRQTIVETIASQTISRLPICDGDLHKPIGYVHAKDILPPIMQNREIVLRDIMHPLLFVPEQASVLDVLDQFKTKKTHIAIVVDEFGETEGLVTLSDILESITGGLPEIGETDEPGIIQRDDGSWLVDGSLPTDEVEQVTNISMGGRNMTVAAFMLQHFDIIPESGMHFDLGDVRFEVVDMDGKRIDKVLIEERQEKD